MAAFVAVLVCVCLSVCLPGAGNPLVVACIPWDCTFFCVLAQLLVLLTGILSWCDAPFIVSQHIVSGF